VSRYRSQVREVINRNIVVSLALAQGFNAFLPVYDSGVDFILYQESDGVVHKVQLKGRWTIDRKYVGRDIWIAFPIGANWYLMPHDEMVAIAEVDGAANSRSWLVGGAYSRPRPSKALIAACAPHRFADASDVAADAASEKGEGSS